MSKVSGVKAIYKASQALSKVIKVDTATRTDVVKKVWEYIKTNNLQDTSVKSQINNDALMKAVFNKPIMKNTEIMGGIGKHLTKTE